MVSMYPSFNALTPTKVPKFGGQFRVEVSAQASKKEAHDATAQKVEQVATRMLQNPGMVVQSALAGTAQKPVGALYGGMLEMKADKGKSVSATVDIVSRDGMDSLVLGTLQRLQDEAKRAGGVEVSVKPEGSLGKGDESEAVQKALDKTKKKFETPLPDGLRQFVKMGDGQNSEFIHVRTRDGQVVEQQQQAQQASGFQVALNQGNGAAWQMSRTSFTNAGLTPGFDFGAVEAQMNRVFQETEALMNQMLGPQLVPSLLTSNPWLSQPIGLWPSPMPEPTFPGVGPIGLMPHPVLTA